jgi:hypothetical protein
VTETEWLTCPHPESMLDFLREKLTDRKHRLFICACVRQLWEALPDERLADAVEVGEAYADGEIEESEREDWFRSLRRAFEVQDDSRLRVWFRCAADLVRRPVRPGALGTPAMMNPDRLRECALLRDVVGNPFRSVEFDPAWRTPTAVNLAQVAYAERRFDDLPVLADALEDAGCTDADLLGHCRGPGPHVRGCWAVDLLLGKE